MRMGLVCTGLCGNEFSEYLLETRVLTSVDFNMYPKQFFLLLIWAFEKIVAIFATLHLETLSEQLPKKLRDSIICTLMSKVYT